MTKLEDQFSKSMLDAARKVLEQGQEVKPVVKEPVVTEQEPLDEIEMFKRSWNEPSGKSAKFAATKAYGAARTKEKFGAHSTNTKVGAQYTSHYSAIAYAADHALANEKNPSKRVAAVKNMHKKLDGVYPNWPVSDAEAQHALDHMAKARTKNMIGESTRGKWPYRAGAGPQALRNPNFAKNSKKAATSKALDKAVDDIKKLPVKEAVHFHNHRDYAEQGYIHPDEASRIKDFVSRGITSGDFYGSPYKEADGYVDRTAKHSLTMKHMGPVVNFTHEHGVNKGKSFSLVVGHPQTNESVLGAVATLAIPVATAAAAAAGAISNRFKNKKSKLSPPTAALPKTQKKVKPLGPEYAHEKTRYYDMGASAAKRTKKCIPPATAHPELQAMFRAGHEDNTKS